MLTREPMPAHACILMHTVLPALLVWDPPAQAYRKVLPGGAAACTALAVASRATVTASSRVVHMPWVDCSGSRWLA